MPNICENCNPPATVRDILCEILAVNSGTRTLLSTETLLVSNVSVGFASIPVDATGAIIQIWDVDISYRLDGTAATTVSGENFRANDGDIITLNTTAELSNFRAIRLTLTDAKLYIQYTS